MNEQAIAERAAELARALPESSTLEYWNDPAERKVGYFLNGERISAELFTELSRIIRERREQECAESGHCVGPPRCQRCGAAQEVRQPYYSAS